MIVGNGDIASVLPDRDDLLFFASGVSNSKEDREEEYKREYNLLMDQNRERHIVYFSSLSVFYSDTPYARFKKEQEKIIKSLWEHWTIIRLGNITWGDNPNTLINFLRKKIKDDESFSIEPVSRYVVDKEEFLHWIELIPQWNAEMNIPGKRMLVAEIVSAIMRQEL